MSCKTCRRALLPEHEDKDGNCCFCAPENFKEPVEDSKVHVITEEMLVDAVSEIDEEEPVKKFWKSESAPPKPKRKRKDHE